MRRILACVTPNGESVVTIDGQPSQIIQPAELPGLTLTNLWATDPIPKLTHPDQDAAESMPMLPEAGGTCFRLVQIEAGHGMQMHATDTVDYLVVLQGEVVLSVEVGPESKLTSGGCVVQMGARHAWDNRGNVPCVLAAVVIGAKRS